MPISGLTALQGLRDVGRIEAGSSVLIIGASGGVGTFAVQIAKAFGAEVTGVCSTAKLDLVRSLGADHVIDYTREDFADGRQRYDLILDIGGNSPLVAAPARAHPARNARHRRRRERRPLDRRLRPPAARRRAVAVRAPAARHEDPKEHHADLERLARLIEAGKLMPVIDGTYPLEQAPDAMRHLQAGQARGKLVITISPAERA